MIDISAYLVTKYKGVYRLRAFYDLAQKTFPRELNGQFSTNDIFIDCQQNIKIFHFGKQILQAYIPSIGRGHNIIKAIKEEFHGEDIIYHIEETDSEILFKFHSDNMDKLEKYLKPKTSGASISPFSSKNLPKTKYDIPEEDLEPYKEIVERVGQERILEVTHATNRYIKSLATKKNSMEKIKADMALKGLKGKNYIHAIGKWKDYVEYLNKNIS